jgi:hypothetical protein
MSTLRVKFTALTVASFGMVAQNLLAADFTLVNNNSTLGINAVSGGSGPAGINSWVVDGVEQLKFQSFYYRIGTGPEYALDNITSTPFVSFTGGGIDITYSNSSLSLLLSYDLFGNQVGSQNSGLGYSVQVLNKLGTSLDFHLFQYSDYDLGGTSAGQNVVMEKITSGPVSLRKFKSAGQTFGPMWMTNVFSLTALPSPTPLAEAGLYNSTLLSLTDGAQTTLNNATNAGPGDVAYAVQWDIALAGNSSASLSGSFTMAVPEPSSFSFLIASMLGLAGMSYRRRVKSVVQESAGNK